MSTPPGFDLDRELTEALQTAATVRMGQFDPRTLSWLVLLPEWTTGLATETGLAGTSDLPGLVDRLEAANLVERREVLGDDGHRHQAFWVRSGARHELAQYLAEVRGRRLDDDLTELAASVAGLATQEPSLRGWLDLVERHRDDPSGRSLLSEVERLISSDRLGDAAALVAMASALGQVVGGPLADAARRGQWRVDREHRTAEDTQHLRHYYRRREVEGELDTLLSGRTESWALHLLGAGGVGKTMVVRYLASGRYATDRGRAPFPVARADFDHLDPRYPQQRPAELLLALTEEFAGFGLTRVSYSYYRRFRDAADALHEELARTGGEAPVQDELMRQVVRDFTRVLADLSASAVLVLDTCEELAKLYPPGSPAPAIDWTFRLLELLHDAYPGLRVVLAGRRWLVPALDDQQQAGGPLLSARPYLRVVTVPGFTRDEAEGYLNQRQAARAELALGGPVLPARLRAALLHRARERRDGEDRYNPFELSAYCEWAFSEPSLDPDELVNAPGDPYVERRILGRLGDGPARDGLAVAAELGRFDQELAAPGWRRAGVDPAAAFHWIAGQEWVRVLSLDAGGRPRVIEIDEHLLHRIRAAVTASRSRYPADREQLGRDAAEAIERSMPLSDLPAETVEAAVRLLRADDASALWRALEERVVNEDAWAWASQVTPRVAAIEMERAKGNGPTILAAILATQAATRIHTESGQVVAALWREAERIAARHPNGRERSVLETRAAFGRVAVGDMLSVAAPWTAIPLWGGPPGSFAAALEGAFVRHKVPPGVPPLGLSAAIELASSLGDRKTAAMALLAKAETALTEGEHDIAAAAADQAIAAADAPAGTPAPKWADWVPPRGLLDRCRLIRLWIALERGVPLDMVPWRAWRADALDRLDDIDAERLVALTVEFELGHRLIDADELRRLEGADSYVPGRRPVTWRHRLIGPLSVELAQAWSARQAPGRSRDLLVRRREEAVAAGDDPDMVEACDMGLLRLCRRFRTTKYSPSARYLAREGSVAVRAEAWLVLTLVNGERPVDPQQAGSWHAWWQCQDVRSLSSVPRPAPFVVKEPGVSALTSEADMNEVSLMGLERAHAEAARPGQSASWETRKDLLEAMVRLRRARTGPPGELGRAALAAGETSALRVPREAVIMLTTAADQLQTAGDLAGTGQAQLLAALAAARMGDRVAAEQAWQRYRQLDAGAILEPVEGWRSRSRAVRAYLGGRAERADSPELIISPIARPAAVPAVQPPAPAGPHGSGSDPNPRVAHTRGFGSEPIAVPQQPTAGPSAAGRPSPIYSSKARTWRLVLVFGVLLAAGVLAVAVNTVRQNHTTTAQPSIQPSSGSSTVGGASRPPSTQPASRPPSTVPPRSSRPVIEGASRPPSTQPASRPPSTVPPRGSRPVSTPGAWVARILLAALVAALAAGVPIVAVALWQATRLRGYRIRGARTVKILAIDADTVQLELRDHRGTASLDERLLTRIGAWLRKRAPYGTMAWPKPGTPGVGSPRAALSGLRYRLPTVHGKRSLILLQLDIPLDLEAYPWEGLVAGVLPASTARAVLAYRCRGGRPARRLSPPAPAVFRGPRHLAPPSAPNRQGVAHLVGTPVRTSAGWRLRTASETSLITTGQSRGTEAGEELLATDFLGLDRRALVVLQAEPVDENPEPLGDLREGFTGLARSALDGGAPAALVLPSLPDELAVEAVDMVGREMRHRRLPAYPSDLVVLTARLKALVADWPNGTDARNTQPGQDVLLFLGTSETIGPAELPGEGA